MKPRELLEILHTAERLKNAMRHSWTSSGRHESVAEHSWRLTLMAYLISEEFPDIDRTKLLKMCLIHDLGECFIGDIPSFNKTGDDEERERNSLAAWVSSLPADISEEMRLLYEEMDALESREAKIYRALDKMEAVIQHNEAPLDTWIELEYTLNQTYAFDTVAFDDRLTALRREILTDTVEKLNGQP